MSNQHKIEVKLKITGVTCNSCVNRIKLCLADKFPNLIDYNDSSSIVVDLNEKIFTIQILDDKFDVKQLIKTIEALDTKYSCVLLSSQLDSSGEFDKDSQTQPLLSSHKGSDLKNSIQISNGKEKSDTKRKCYVSIQGMTCSSCVDKIERKLNSTQGIFHTQIGLISARGEVDFNPLVITPVEIVDILEDMGYETNLISVIDSNQQTELKLDIMGVTSSQNVESITSTVSQMIGVASIEIVQETGRTSIIYYHDIIGPRKIVNQIKELGYTVFTFNSFNPQTFTDAIVKEIAKWRSSFFISLIFGVPTILTMIYFMYIVPMTDDSKEANDKMCCVSPGLSLENLILFLLSTPVQLFGARYFYLQAFKSLRNRHLSMDVLIMLATTIAYFYSVGVCMYFMITEQPQSPMTFFDTPPMLLVFISLGRWLEHINRLRTTEYIVLLMSMRPFEATLLDIEILPVSQNSKSDEKQANSKNISIKSERIIPIDLVEKGDYLRVRPGERIPTDGRMVEGTAMVDESFINGESMPVTKRPGSILFGGSIVSNGTVIMIATNVGADSQLCQIVKMVENAQTKKAPIQQLADRISSYFIPFVILASLVTFIVWLSIGNSLFDMIVALNPQFYENMTRTEVIIQFAFQIGLSVMIISCPCALGIATPSAVIIGTGIGAVNGIHIKGAEPLENAQNVKMMIFDKTGTLTYGKPSVTNIRFLKNFPNELMNSLLTKIIVLVGMAESNSDHPIANSVANYVRSIFNMNQDSSFGQLNKFKLEAGLGIRSWISSSLLENFISSLSNIPTFQSDLSSKKISFASFLKLHQSEDKYMIGNSFFETKEFDVLVGNHRWMKANRISVDKEYHDELIRLELQGETVFFVAINKKLICLISVSDTVKPEASLVVYSLRKLFGMEVMLLTGDNLRSARAIGRKVGIRRIFGELLPQHKMEKIKQLQQSGNVVAMVGDGINDAPALAQADLGIAIAKGTDITIESADIVLKRDDLLDIVATIDLSRKTMRRIKINFLLAFIYNVIFIPVAAGVFIYFGLILQPWMSGACMAFSSISVSCSSLFLRHYKKPTKSSLETMQYFRYQERLDQQLIDSALGNNSPSHTNNTSNVNSNLNGSTHSLHSDFDKLSLHNARNLLSSGVDSVNKIFRPAAMEETSSDDDDTTLDEVQFKQLRLRTIGNGRKEDDNVSKSNNCGSSKETGFINTDDIGLASKL